MKNLKKVSSVLLCVLMMAACCFGVMASAATVTDSCVTYTVMSDGASLSVTSVQKGVASILRIPSKVDGKNVVSIADKAFQNQTSVTLIEIPASVTSVGKEAFFNCSGLQEVVFDTSDSYVTIGDSAFGSCDSLSAVTLPQNMTSIPPECFSGCSSLTEISIPDTVTSIGYAAFLDCSSLTSVTVPDSVTAIGETAFSNCSGLQSFTVASGNKYFAAYDGVLYTYDASELIQYPLAKSGTSYTLKSGVKVIDEYAFSNSSVSSVTLPTGLKTIEDYAFSDCKKLTSVTIPGTVEYFSNAFEGSGLVSAKLESGINEIPEYAFSYCTSLKSVTLPSGLQSIGLCAFYRDSALESVIIPAGTASVDSAAFSECTSLKKVHMPESLTSIESNAFDGSSNVVICSYSDKFYSKTFASENGISFTTCTGDEIPSSQVVIKNSGSKSISYGETAVLTVDSSSVPAECSVQWDVTGSGYSVSKNGNTCTITCTGTGTASVTAKLMYGSTVISTATENIACTGKPVPSSQIVIKNNSGSRSINYGYTLVMTVDSSTVPADCSVQWDVSGSGYSVSKNGNTCSVRCTGSGTANVTAKLVYSGSVISTATEKVTCNSNFFLKIAAFFKNLFRSNMTIYQ